jgi:uncharacterized protein (DUF433 family)
MLVSVLDQEMYTEAEAARLLRVPQSTLNYWLEGGQQRGRTYKPVIRPEPKGGRAPVTWAEFIEAGLLRSYRRDLGVRMAELCTFIDDLRNRLGVPYPLADRRPYVSNRQLLLDAQEHAGLDPDLWLVANVHGQLLLLPPSAEFVQRVTWDGDIAVGWRPHDEQDSPVRISPELRYGRPAVGGVSTEVLWEHVEAGESLEEVVFDFGVSEAELRWAVAYETAARVA